MATLTIGRRLTVAVDTIARASAAYVRAREASTEGASTFPDGIIRAGKRAYRVSYNGRVWVSTKKLSLQSLEVRPGCHEWTAPLEDAA